MKQIYLSLLILGAILSQGILNLSEGNNKNSSGLLVRKKRLIDRRRNGNKPVPIADVPYIVAIHTNGRVSCGGSILLPYLVITAAHCVEKIGNYHVLSGSSYRNRGIQHTILNILLHPERKVRNIPTFTYDLALLIIWPYIDFAHSRNREIPLFHGYIPPDTPCTISGWGCNEIKCGLGCLFPSKKMSFPQTLRSFTVPSISLEECKRRLPYSDNSDKNICTYDRVEGKTCSKGDSGAPLVVDGQLAGVYSWSRGCGGPNVFMNLSHPEYRNWILNHTVLQVLQLQDPESPQRKTPHSISRPNSPHHHHPSMLSHLRSNSWPRTLPSYPRRHSLHPVPSIVV